MSTDKGYIKLNRSIEDNWIWDEKPFSKGQAWIDLLLMANYQDKNFQYGGEIIQGKRGCVYRSILFLADRWGWSRDKTTRFLRKLEMDKMIHLNPTKHNTTITIINYCFYQDKPTTNKTTSNTTTRQQPDNNPTYTRNIKKYKERKEINNKPSAEEDLIDDPDDNEGWGFE